MNSGIIEKYRDIHPTYVAYTKKLHALVEDLLTTHGIRFHLIESRAKSIQSFSEKISRPNKNYHDPINQITDLSGLRIIVFYNDDVATVAKLIEKEFIKLEIEHNHQVENYDADSFGYLSLHYIIKINQARAKLSEWAAFKDIATEVQIRTVLQHSWATISHAMQYKREEDVPKPLRRRLFRLAGLFELVDEEFLSLKNEAKINIENTTNSISKGKTDIEISPYALRAFMESWEGLEELTKFMKRQSYVFLPDDEDSEGESMNYYGKVAKHCDRIGIKTILQIKESLEINFKDFIEKANHFNETEWKVSNSFLLYLLIIRAFREEFTAQDLINSGWYDMLAKHVIKAASET